MPISLVCGQFLPHGDMLDTKSIHRQLSFCCHMEYDRGEYGCYECVPADPTSSSERSFDDVLLSELNHQYIWLL